MVTLISIFSILLLVLPTTLGQAHFRSILIERACLKRPTLDFCAEFTTLPPTTTTSAPTTTAALILPPNADLKIPGDLPTPPPVVETTSASVVDFGEKKNEEKERLGSLLRLPKPAGKDEDEKEQVVPLDVSSSKPSENGTEEATTPAVEDGKSVLVFVSEYCVVEREHFVRSCHGETPEAEVPFCKSYPPACASTHGVIPVVSYCQRYYKQYPKHCITDMVSNDVVQFCFAFEQFCLPELTPAQPLDKPKSSLKRCEDIASEARKVCNPFPHPKDTFNVLRCSQFLTNCKKFVDWA